MTDEQLMAAYVAGDERAFNELVARYREMVERYTGLQAADAADVAQESFATLASLAVDHWQPGRLFRPWLFTIADRLSREKRAADRQTARMLATPEAEVMAEVYQR